MWVYGQDIKCRSEKRRQMTDPEKQQTRKRGRRMRQL